MVSEARLGERLALPSIRSATTNSEGKNIREGLKNCEKGPKLGGNSSKNGVLSEALTDSIMVLTMVNPELADERAFFGFAKSIPQGLNRLRRLCTVCAGDESPAYRTERLPTLVQLQSTIMGTGTGEIF